MLLHRTLDRKQKPIPRLWGIWGQSSRLAVSRGLSIFGRKMGKVYPIVSDHFSSFPLFNLSLFTSQLPLSFSLLFPWRIKIAGNKRCRPRSSAHILAQEPSFIHSFDLTCIGSVPFACCWGTGARGCVCVFPLYVKESKEWLNPYTWCAFFERLNLCCVTFLFQSD